MDRITIASIYRIRGRALRGCLLGILAMLPVAAGASEGLVDYSRYFENQVRPILAAECWKCHGAKPKIKAGLRLTRREAILQGGDSGPAVQLEQPADSLLLKMLSYVDEDHEMPPRGKLPAAKIEVLTQWVQWGVPWSTNVEQLAKASSAAPGDAEPEAASGRDYWAYRKPVRPDAPAVRDARWVRNPIDAFILARLEQAGLAPDAPASRLTLIRRATYDLTGLPPTAEEIDAFLRDPDPAAYERLIDRLLASPHYGEKWGRHWLDLARYAETNGYERDSDKPHAWRYRDYVIRAFNDDKPYDRFLLEQLAGDELDPPTPEAIIATGFYRLGLMDDEPADRERARYDDLDDVISTISKVMLGTTVGCARCHDHKKDPIPQEDYYRLLAFVRNINPNAKSGGSVERAIGQENKALCVTEPNRAPAATHVLIRGNPRAPGKVVAPGFPRVLGFPDPEIVPNPKSKTSGRRLALAQWLVRPDHPLTARVMANRLWQYHFGRGIVPTPNDFGRLGQPPTHPQLLDWLATEFVARGWSLKAMHKLIMTSSAYRMASADQARALAVDPANHLFWRFNLRRLTAEEIRDSILAVNGTLNLKLGGPSVYPPVPPEVLATASRPNAAWGKSSPEEAARRSVYVKVKRSLLLPMLASHDFADTDGSCAVRFATTVPTQSLTMLNSQFMNQQAAILADRLRADAPGDPAAQVRRALRWVTQRPPRPHEIARGLKLIKALESEGEPREQALDHFCLLALNLNEFVYLD